MGFAGLTRDPAMMMMGWVVIEGNGVASLITLEGKVVAIAYRDGMIIIAAESNSHE